MTGRTPRGQQPSLAEYGLIGDCHAAALISRAGGIDWCSLPRFDSPSVFGRLLDWERGGTCRIAMPGQGESRRRYVDGSLVLETTWRSDEGEARVTDCFAMCRGGRHAPRRELLRVIEGVQGELPLEVVVAPRFDYGRTSPWIREVGRGLFTAVGSSNGLAIWSDLELQPVAAGELGAHPRIRRGERRRLAIRFVPPETIDHPPACDGDTVDRHLEETLQWWRAWVAKAAAGVPLDALRSAILLKALIFAPTGGMIAAPTTSLPEALGGERNWDYRFCWIRDSAFAVRSLAEIGFHAEAEGFCRFVERSAAGNVAELQVLYGVGGERMVPEIVLPELAGYRDSRPVRIGNAAAEQLQLDIYGELLDLAWQWHRRRRAPDADYLRFLAGIVDRVAEVWSGPDRGIWEVRGDPQHFVHSKAMCWVALDRGVRLARAYDLPGGAGERWERECERVRDAIEHHGYDPARGIFVRAFGGADLDASLLLLPEFGFVAYDDPRMIRTTDAIRAELCVDGLVHRYRSADGLPGGEGAFVACTFWLAECLARQGRTAEAREVYQRGWATANDLGLLAEEFDVSTREMLGNFPQGLTHLSHVQAAVALAGLATHAGAHAAGLSG